MLGNEIIQFATATLVEPGKYILSNLLRGRLGTEWAIATHSAGESFVLINNRLAKQSIPDSMIGLERMYKAVSFGATLSDTSAHNFTYQAVSLRPYTPVHITGSRDTSDNLSIKWIRRARLGGNWLDGADVPLYESREVYDIDILDGNNIVRTIKVNDTNSAIYSATEQILDFGSTQSNIDIHIYQLSDKIGRGYAANASL